MYSVQVKILLIFRYNLHSKHLYMVHLMEFLKRAATERNAPLRAGCKNSD